jgi:hypothetical protein
MEISSQGVHELYVRIVSAASVCSAEIKQTLRHIRISFPTLFKFSEVFEHV